MKLTITRAQADILLSAARIEQEAKQRTNDLVAMILAGQDIIRPNAKARLEGTTLHIEDDDAPSNS